MDTTGISLWLIPPSNASQALEAVITSIALKHDSPKFRPHITLYSFPATLDVDLAALLPPQEQLPPAFPITFQRVCTGQTYFQSVLIELEKQDGSDFQNLRDQIDEINQRLIPGSAKKFFYPHLSLFYGDPPMEAKERIINDLKEEGVVSKSGPLTVGGVEAGFRVSEIWVVKTEGPVEGWEILKKVALKSSE